MGPTQPGRSRSKPRRQRRAGRSAIAWLLRNTSDLPPALADDPMSDEFRRDTETGTVRAAHFRWSQESSSIVTLWTVEHQDGSSCAAQSCDAPSCTGIELPEGLEKNAPRFAGRTRAEHRRLHLNSPHHCPLHKPKVGPKSTCERHRKALARLRKGLAELGITDRRSLGRLLDRIATAIDYVVVAEQAASASELRRLSAPKTPARDRPRGWRLGADILQEFGIPDDFLPERRDSWVPAARGKTTRRDASLDALRRAWLEVTDAQEAYDDAINEPRRAWVEALRNASEAESGTDGSWKFDPASEHGKRIVAAERTLEEAKLQHSDLGDTVDRAEAAYEELHRDRRATLVPGRPVSLPRSGLSPLWTCCAKAIVDFVNPIASKVETTRHGVTPTALASAILTTLAPPHHLDREYTHVRDRLS